MNCIDLNLTHRNQWQNDEYSIGYFNYESKWKFLCCLTSILYIYFTCFVIVVSLPSS